MLEDKVFLAYSSERVFAIPMTNYAFDPPTGDSLGLVLCLWCSWKLLGNPAILESSWFIYRIAPLMRRGECYEWQLDLLCFFSRDFQICLTWAREGCLWIWMNCFFVATPDLRTNWRTSNPLDSSVSEEVIVSPRAIFYIEAVSSGFQVVFKSSQPGPLSKIKKNSARKILTCCILLCNWNSSKPCVPTRFD